MSGDEMTLFELGDFVPVTVTRNIQADFEAFHAANSWVYHALVLLARDLRNRGNERFGIGMLFEVLRWRWHLQSVVTITLGDFKLNNNYRSRYARLIMDNEPDLVDVFETRNLRAA